MKAYINKLDVITVTAVVIFAISLSIMDFEDLSWYRNSKSYFGIAIFFALIILRIITSRRK